MACVRCNAEEEHEPWCRYEYPIDSHPACAHTVTDYNCLSCIERMAERIRRHHE